jgi:predicted nucleotidyltransferase
MSNINLQRKMIETVANALGEELISEMVFVGGCTTGLLVTDEFTKEQIRYTDDVDLIVDVMGYPAWTKLQETLKTKGFSIDMGEEVICRMSLGDLTVDFMPADGKVLGFSNIWYTDAMTNAQSFPLTESTVIRLIKPEYFVATKLEAYKGRGKGNALHSRDIEDIICVFDGRPSIVEEVLACTDERLQKYISDEFKVLFYDDNFEYAVQDASRNDDAREKLIFERLEGCLIDE